MDYQINNITELVIQSCPYNEDRLTRTMAIKKPANTDENQQ